MNNFRHSIIQALGVSQTDLPLCPTEFGDAFLDDIWQMLPLSVKKNYGAVSQNVGKTLYRFFNAPRHERIVETYLKDRLLALEAPENITIYPASTLGRSLADWIHCETDHNVIGYVDRFAKEDDLGLKVHNLDYPPKIELPDNTLFVVCSAEREFLFNFLLEESGVPNERILSVCSDDEFDQWWGQQESLQQEFALPTNIEPKDFLVISTYASSIIPWESIASICPADRTNFLYLGPDYTTYPTTPFNIIKSSSSAADLKQVIKQTNPKLIYIATLAPEHYWSLITRYLAPDTPVIQDFYDIVTHIPNDSIYQLHSTCPELMTVSRLAEYTGSQDAAAFITKRCGPQWRKTQKTFTTPYLRYCQGMVSHEFTQPTHHPDSLAETKCVYAGPIPPYETANDWPFYRFMDLLESIPDIKGVDLDTFNSFHSKKEDDSKFQRWMKSINRNGSSYNRALPHEHLLKKMQAYDYGWMCLNRWTDIDNVPDTRTVISARVTGYLSAYLPIIVDTTWDATAELVEEFHAGIVIDDPTPEKIAEILPKKIDRERHRAGANALRKHLLEENEKTRRWLVNFSKSIAGKNS